MSDKGSDFGDRNRLFSAATFKSKIKNPIKIVLLALTVI